MEKPYKEHDFYGPQSFQPLKPEEEHVVPENDAFKEGDSINPLANAVKRDPVTPITGVAPEIGKASDDTGKKRHIDFLGFIFLLVGIVSIISGVVSANKYGWLIAKDSPLIFGYLIVLWGISIVPFLILFGMSCLFFVFLWKRRVKKAYK